PGRKQPPGKESPRGPPRPGAPQRGPLPQRLPPKRQQSSVRGRRRRLLGPLNSRPLNSLRQAHRRTRPSVAKAASASDHNPWFLVRRVLVLSPQVPPIHPRDPLPRPHPEPAPRQHVVKIVAL